MMHVSAVAVGKTMKMWPDAKPFTKVARDWTQPRIACMRVVIFVAVKNQHNH
jgi:hypothetical protein